MPARLDRATFVSTLEATPLPLEKLEQDATLRAIIPHKADLDGNGLIHGANEYDRLFTQVDSYGRGEDAQATTLVGPDGKATQSAVALKALAELTANRDVLGWTAGVDFSKTEDLTQIRSTEQGTPTAVLSAAARLVRDYKQHYGNANPWLNLDPNHALPTNVPLRGLGKTEQNPGGRFKCNLFLGNTLAVAGFEPPYYGNKGKGEYPNANQFYKFTDKYAAQWGNKVHFNLVAEVELEGKSSDEARLTLTQALRQAKPGDLILVDHRGDEVSDGGHGRVLMKNDLREDGTGELHSGQATYSEGTIRREGLSSFTGEARVWILRPTLKRTTEPKPKPQTQTQVQPQTVRPQTQAQTQTQTVRPQAQPQQPASQGLSGLFRGLGQGFRVRRDGSNWTPVSR